MERIKFSLITRNEGTTDGFSVLTQPSDADLSLSMPMFVIYGMRSQVFMGPWSPLSFTQFARRFLDTSSPPPHLAQRNMKGNGVL